MAVFDFNEEFSRARIREILKRPIRIYSEDTFMSGYTYTSTSSGYGSFYSDYSKFLAKESEVIKSKMEKHDEPEEKPVFHFDPKELVNDQT